MQRKLGMYSPGGCGGRIVQSEGFGNAPLAGV
jgi:hypothetical protein